MDFLKRNSKNIIIGILLILFISACIFIFYLLKNKKIEVLKDITGNVIIADKEYLIIESNNENYLISNIKGTYEVGDIVKFSYLESAINNEQNPKEIKINDEELVEKNKLENNKNEETDNNDSNTTNNENKAPINNNQTPTNNNVTSKPNNNANSNQNQNNNSSNSESADVAVMNYMNELETEMNKPSLGESAKKGFITVVDFLFYNGTIKGHTFSELSNTVKLKVLSMAMYFDSKIDKYFPGYKESISSTTKSIYNNVKASIVSAYLEITTSICKSNSELCSSAKEGFESIKKNFGLSFELIKEIAGDGIDNLKNWYEIWSGK